METDATEGIGRDEEAKRPGHLFGTTERQLDWFRTEHYALSSRVYKLERAQEEREWFGKFLTMFVLMIVVVSAVTERRRQAAPAAP